MDVRNEVHGDAGRAAPRRRDRLRAVAFAAAALILALAAAGTPARAVEAEAAASKPFTICDDQTYALCATSTCTMFNDVAYCKCDVKKGDSISLSLDYNKNKDVCDFNAQGKRNGYMVSTYSFPESVGKGGDMATYACPKTSTGTYAQCDGGICWQSSRGQRFPGLGKLDDAEIVCACPTTTASGDAEIGFQIAGPYPCQQDFFKYCESATANTDNGSRIFVGAPTGSARFLTKRLYGESFPTNKCLPTGG